ALDCVRVKGEIDEDLSAEEAPTANDGLYEYRLHVPDDIKPGCDICAQGFVAGDAGGGGGGGGGPQELRSERHWFMSGSPTAARPGIPAPQAAPAELPRTGAAAARTGTAGGGLALCLGGLAVIGGAGRRTRRRTAV